MKEQDKIRQLQQKATFNVSDFVFDEEEKLISKINFEELTSILIEMMDVKEIDGEELYECMCKLTHVQAFIQAEQQISYNEQMMIDRACY